MIDKIEDKNKKQIKYIEKQLILMKLLLTYFLLFGFGVMLGISEFFTQICYMFIFAGIPTLFIFALRTYIRIVNST